MSTSIGWSGIAQCKVCAAGKYKDSIGSVACTACLANSQSSNASSLSTDCKCYTDYTVADSRVCISCPQNTYKSVIGITSC